MLEYLDHPLARFAVVALFFALAGVTVAGDRSNAAFVLAGLALVVGAVKERRYRIELDQPD